MDKAIPWADELLGLEPEHRLTLSLHLRRELDREYAPKQRNKALKWGPSHWEDLAIAGEQLRAVVREGAQLFRVDMTFPLFDLDSDFTLIRCSCLREALSLEALRCPHMYYLQKSLLESLSALEEQDISSAEPVNDWEDFFLAPESEEESFLYERRWHLSLDVAAWQLEVRQEKRNRFDPNAFWQAAESLDWAQWRRLIFQDKDPLSQRLQALLQETRGGEAAEVFAILRDSGLTIFEKGGAGVLEPEKAQCHLQVLDKGAMCELSLGIGGRFDLQPRRIPGVGCYAVFERASGEKSLLLVSLLPREEDFVSRLLNQGLQVPRDQREKLLESLDRLDVRAFAPKLSESPSQPVRAMQTVLRLTPFSKGGMRIDVRIQVAKHLSVQPGEGDECLHDHDEAASVWQRDLATERQLARSWVKRLDLELLPEPEPYIFIAYSDQLALDFLQRLEAFQLDPLRGELRVEWPRHLQQKPYALAQPISSEEMQISLGEKKDWFQLEGWLQLEDGRKLELKQVLAMLRRQERYIQLNDGRWAMLSEHFRNKIAPLVTLVDEDAEGLNIDLAALGTASAVETLSQFPFAQEAKSFWSLVQRAKHAFHQEASLPAGLQADLRPYQLEGFRWMAQLYDSQLGCVLADDMGLGKTLQTLTLLLQKAAYGPSLVVAPSSLSYNWASEAARFCPSLKVVLLRELSDRGQNQEFGPGQIVIASYGLLQRYAESLARMPWNVLVFDEAQAIKNAQTKTARSAQQLQARWKIALSGTPIENRLSELWALFRSVSPGLFGEWERFRRSYVFPIERDKNSEAQQRLKRKLAPFVLRRLKKDYLSELPEKTELDLWIDLSADEREAYDALRGEAVAKLAALPEGNAQTEAQQKIQILAALTRLRQAACHRELIDSEWQGASSKIEFLREQLSQLREAGHAVLIFSQFTRFLGKIEEALIGDGAKVLYLDGQTPPLKRKELVDRFQSGEGDVFLISLKAGGTGLNLTRASYVFHMDPWWNPAVENQATDRAYRMGQKRAVTVYKLRAKETIEEVIHAVHGEKRELMEGLLEGRDPGAAWSWDVLWDMLTQKGNPKKSCPSLRDRETSTEVRI